MICLYVALGIILLVEYYSLGVFFLAKGFGMEKPYKNFIPFYAFKTARQISGPFTVLTIPVKRFATTVIIVSCISIFALLFAVWGDTNLPYDSMVSLWQIMWLVMGLMIGIFYLSIVSIMPKMCRRFSVDREKLFVVLSLLIVTIPVLFYLMSKNPPKADKDMY